MKKQKFKVDLHAGPDLGEIVELDSHTWWLAQHCGPGSTDAEELCGFCGEPMRVCAHLNTAEIRTRHRQFCGGAGFWCPKCGLFWAQDVCGERFNAEFSNANPELKLTVKDGKVLCSCGEYLFDFEEEVV